MTNIECEKNRRLDLEIEVTDDEDVPFDLTEYDVKMEVKKHPLGTALLTLEKGDELTIEENIITLSVQEIDLPASVYVYDIMIENEEGKQTILKGNFTVFNSVTT